MHLRFNILVLFVCIILVKCNSKEKFSYVIPHFDSVISAKKISINKLAQHYKSLNGQYIETEGTFFSAFEEFAIYTDKKFFSNERDGFWMDVNNNLFTNQKDWDSVYARQGTKILIKGKVDTSRHGHLGGYLATITDIYFFKEE